jgi:hypothetical protein
MAESAAHERGKEHRGIVRVRFFGVGELVAAEDGYEVLVYRDREEALALGAAGWTEGDMPMGGGCWNEWSDPDPRTGEVEVTCGRAQGACPEGCELWESVLGDDGHFRWVRRGVEKIKTREPGRFLCGCKKQTA